MPFKLIRFGFGVVLAGLSCIVFSPVCGAKIGPVEVNPSVELSVEWNDNVNTSEFNPLDDFIASARLNFVGSWEVTRINTLNFSFGLGYAQYFKNDELNRSNIFFNIAPETEVTFEVYFSEYLRLKLSDQLKVLRDPSDVALINENGQIQTDVLQFNRFENAFSADLEWEMNSKNTINLQYTRKDLLPIDTEFESTQRTTQSLSITGSRRFTSAWTGGLSASYFWTRYKVNRQNDGAGYSLSAFSTYQLSQFMTLSGRIGQTWNIFETNGRNGDFTDPSNWFWSLELSHSPLPTFSYLAGWSRVESLGYISNTTLVERAYITAVWTAFSWGDLTATISREWGEESGGFIAEKYTRWFGSIGTEASLGPNSSISASYRFTDKVSNRLARSYLQNAVVISFVYRF